MEELGGMEYICEGEGSVTQGEGAGEVVYARLWGEDDVGVGGACDLTNRRSCQPPQPILARPARRPYLSSNQRLLRISSGLMYCRRRGAIIDHSIAHSHARESDQAAAAVSSVQAAVQLKA